mgnify:FL=1
MLILCSLLLTGLCVFGQEPGDEKDTEALQNMLGNILSQGNKANEASLPMQYEFDYLVTMENWEENKKKDRMTLMWTGNHSLTGMRNDGNLMVFDNDQEVIVQYDQKKMEANILPNVMKGMGEFMQSEVEDELQILSVEKTGNKKTILGYSCEEILVETEKESSRAWVTYELKTSLQDILDNTMDIKMESFIDEKYAEEFKNAFALYVEATNKKNGKKQYTEVKEIDTNYRINNTKYKVQR